MDWHVFTYLNQTRRNINLMADKLAEFAEGFNQLGIATSKGEIETAMAMNIAELSKLSGLLMKRIQHERKKDITLFLEDV